jgi:hypothetical protein
LKHAKGQRAARHHGEKRKLGQLMRQGWLSHGLFHRRVRFGLFFTILHHR